MHKTPGLKYSLVVFLEQLNQTVDVIMIPVQQQHELFILFMSCLFRNCKQKNFREMKGASSIQTYLFCSFSFFFPKPIWEY